MTSTTSSITANDGVTLLTRNWERPDPRAQILLIHGLGEHSGRWEHVGGFFVDRGYAVNSFDLRGHGASGGRRVHIEDYNEFLDDVELMLAEMPDDTPSVIYGHSMGGLIGTGYAVSDRPQPDYYVLSAPALEADIPAALQIASKLLRRVVPKLPLPNSVKGEQLSRDASVGERYFADPLVQTKATANFGTVMLEAMTSVRERLDHFTQPALVIHGADDPLVPPQASAPLAAVPSVERKLFPGLRHETHNEPERDEVLGFVADWLDNQLA